MQTQKRVCLFCAGAAALVLAASCTGTPPAPELAATTSAALSTPATPTVNTFVVYAANNVTLGAGDHSVGGDIGVATSNGSSPQLTVGSQDQLDINHALFAPSIYMGNLAQVGAVDTNSLANNGGHVGTQSSYPSSMPPVPAVFAAAPGTTNVTVASGQHQTLSPGPYGTLIDNGIVFLNPGTYSFSSVALGNSAQLQALQGGSTSVLVAGNLSTGTFAQIFPAGQPANELTISVSGGDGASGPAVSLGANTQVISLLEALNGTVSLGNNVQATGAFAGVNFTAGTNVQLNFQSGFPSNTPTISTFVAYAELSITLGTGDHSFGGDIGVAHTGASSVGTQLTVASRTQLDTQRTLYAPSVSLGSQAIVGDVEATTLTNTGGSFGPLAPYPASAMPVSPPALATTPGTTNLTVAQGQQQTLNPGSFGTLTDNGIVILNPGTYSFASVTLGNNAQLIAQSGGATIVAIAGTLSTGTGAQIFPAGQAAGNLTISVAGNDGTNGSPPAASIGANTQIVALLNVPHGTLSFANNVQATGAFGGFLISAGNNVTLNFQTGFSPTSQQPGLQVIAGNVPPAVATSPVTGTLPGSAVLTVDIVLPLQANGVPGSGYPAIGTFISQLSSNPSLQGLTPAQFAAAYGPSASSYTTVTNFATANGLSVVRTYTARDVLTVSGTASAIENAFSVTLNVYQRPDGSTFYAPANAPAVNLSVPLVGIVGLDDFSRARRNGSSNLSCTPSPIGPQNGLFGPDFLKAYFGAGCLNSLEGQGQTIALFELDSYLPEDILAYVEGSSLGRPALDVPGLGTSSPLSNVTQEQSPSSQQLSFSTFTFSPSLLPDDSEVLLDMSMVLAVAPRANLIVYEMQVLPGFAPPQPYDSFLAMIADDKPCDSCAARAQTISSSFPWEPVGTSAEITAVQNVFQQFASQRQTFVTGSGDQGAYISTDPYNANFASPQSTPLEPMSDTALMLTVGGTELTTSSTGVYQQETTWNDTNIERQFEGTAENSVTAGGFLTGLPIPSWQANLNGSNKEVASPTGRMVPDVAMVADDVAILCGVSQGGECGAQSVPVPGEPVQQCSGGTSAGAPLWAAMLALINQANGVGTNSSATPVGFVNPTLYNLAADFNDIADGTNNNWFDNGQLFETGSIPPVTGAQPSVALPFSISSDNSGNQINSLLPGAAPLGASEAAGLYHAVTGYDLATGLGTPTCGLVHALAPSTCVTCSGQTGCINIINDANNCGACGNACMQGPCIRGQCEPLVLASGLPQLLDLAVDGTNVYVVAGSGSNVSLIASILSIPVGATTSAPVVLASGVTATNIAVDPMPNANDSALVFFAANGGLDEVFKPNSGLSGTGSFLTSGAVFAEGVAFEGEALALFGGDIFFLQNEASAAVGTPVGVFSLGASFGTEMQLASASLPTWIAADATNVYWVDLQLDSTTGLTDGFVKKVGIGGGTPTTLATVLSTPTLSNVPFGIAVDSNNVYWTTSSTSNTANTTGTVSQVPINGGTVTQLATRAHPTTSS
jgi:hypothetical protein